MKTICSDLNIFVLSSMRSVLQHSILPPDNIIAAQPVIARTNNILYESAEWMFRILHWKNASFFFTKEEVIFYEFQHNQKKMKILFLVQGSTEMPYLVEFTRNSDSTISTHCTCPTSQNGQYCHHRFNIIEGKTTDIVSENLDEVETVQSWIPGSEIETAMVEIQKLDEEIAKAKELLAAVKSEATRAMMN